MTTIYQNTINALQLQYDHQINCEVMDINKAGVYLIFQLL